jgi:hypothetical protein
VSREPTNKSKETKNIPFVQRDTAAYVLVPDKQITCPRRYDIDIILSPYVHLIGAASSKASLNLHHSNILTPSDSISTDESSGIGLLTFGVCGLPSVEL